VRDRLARYECCRKTLTAWEARTEEQDASERAQIGVVYYDLIKQPVDLLSIRGKVEANEYAELKDFERDMKLLFSNARRFDVHVNAADARGLSRDADALEDLLVASLNSAPTSFSMEAASVKDFSSSAPVVDKQPSTKRAGRSAAPTQVQLMLSAWSAVREAQDGKRKIAELFLQLPARDEHPQYYDSLERPIDLTQIKNRIDTRKYKSWQQFERNMMLLFENTRTYNAEASQRYRDANRLQEIFTAQPSPYTQGNLAISLVVTSSAGGNASQGAGDVRKPGATEKLTRHDKMNLAWVAVRNLKVGRRERAAAFLSLPAKDEYADYYGVLLGLTFRASQSTL
jgi:hypothetical protein